MKTPLYMLSIFCGLLVFSGTCFGQVYSWTDENGVKRFSNRRPEGEVKELKIEEEIEYDEEAAARRLAAEKERAQKEQAQKEKEFWENMQYLQMEDRMRTERRLQETEDELEYLSEQLEEERSRKDYRRSYYPYWPTRPCWPRCSDRPPRPPHPPEIEPPDIRPPSVRPPTVDDDSSWQNRRTRSMSSPKTSNGRSRSRSRRSSSPPPTSTFPPRMR